MFASAGCKMGVYNTAVKEEPSTGVRAPGLETPGSQNAVRSFSLRTQAAAYGQALNSLEKIFIQKSSVVFTLIHSFKLGYTLS